MISIVREHTPGAFEEVPRGSSFVGLDGSLHSWQVAELWSDAELAGIGLYRVEPVAIPAGRSVTSIGYERVDGVVAQIVELAPVDLAAYAATVRWLVETGGIMVGGAPITTDRESQAMISGAHAYVQANPSATIKWKTMAGFATLSAEQITALALAVGTHVQSCFSKEAEVAAAIQAGSITTMAEIDAAFAAVVTAY